jgi:hypothetical protein
MIADPLSERGAAMRWSFGVLAVTGILGAFPVTALAQPAGAGGGRAGNCGPGEKIDGSTATDARKKMEAAGYKKVSGLKKGCDNSWHGRAEKDGNEVHVVLNPQGLVLLEGD